MASRRVDGASALQAEPRSTLVAIGNFDGVHCGHRAVLTAAVEQARALGVAPVVLTFDPHPSEVLGRGPQDVLTPLPRKIELLARIDSELRVVVETFTLELARKSPREFCEELLQRALGARVVIVGDNFRFGQGRAGDVETLRELGSELGFAAMTHALEGDEHGAFSSSRIRQAVRDGDLARARRLLGRPHALTGRVVEGQRRGRTLGFPTANLEGIGEMLPPYGVYAAVVDAVTEPSRALARAVVNVGVRPTVEAGLAIEAHLLDFEGDLYGSRLRLHLTDRLRGEQRFDGTDALAAQIRRDVEQARAATAELVPDPSLGTWF